MSAELTTRKFGRFRTAVGSAATIQAAGLVQLIARLLAWVAGLDAWPL